MDMKLGLLLENRTIEEIGTNEGSGKGLKLLDKSRDLLI
jgi:hypothetical protein